MLLAFCFILKGLGKILEYRFGENFGEIFFDFAGNGQFGVNGEDVGSRNKNTVPTDRGAYFSVGDSRVTLPTNELVSSNPYPAAFSIVFWGLFEDFTYFIFSRSSSTNFIKIRRNTINNQLSLHILTPLYDSTELSASTNALPPGKHYVDKWMLVSLIVSTSITLTTNTKLQISFTPSASYSESGNYNTFIGYPDLATGLVGFIWNYIFLNTTLVISEFISLTATSACLVPGCSSCNPAIVYLGATGCLPIEKSISIDSQGNTCNQCSYGCIGTLCLSCEKCLIHTCQVENNIVLCQCGESASPSETYCGCTSDSFYFLNSCQNCYSDCLTCTKEFECDTCISNNSKIVSIGCECIDLYYNTTSLTTVDACIPCNNLCKTCDKFGNCLTCYSTNALASNQCLCNEGYYATGTSCSLCYTECATCTSFNNCTLCKDLNALPNNFGCSCISGYGSTGQITFNGACVKCHEDCVDCRVLNICLTCNDPNAYPVEIGCSCNDGFFLFNGICTSCPSDCKFCNETSCTSCWDNNAEVDGNKCYCPDGFFQLDEAEITGCGMCNNDCLTCEDSRSCIECRVVGALPADVGCTCQEFYYNNGIQCAACLNWNYDEKKCIFCMSNEYFQNNQCVMCPYLCASCSVNECHSCVENAEIYNSICVCKYLYTGVSSCYPTKFFMTPSIDLHNNIILTFTQDLKNPLLITDISLTISQISFKSTFSQWSTRQYSFKITYFSPIISNKSASLSFLTTITSILNETLEITAYSIPLTLQNITKSQLQPKYQSQASTSVIVLSSLSLILTIINFNPVSLWSFLNALQLLIYMRLSSIYIPPKLNSVLSAFSSLSIFPNIFKWFIEPESSDIISQKFQEFGFASTNFFLNAGDMISALIFILVNMGIFMVLDRIKRFRPFSIKIISNFIESSLAKFRYSTYLRFYIQSYIKLAVCSLFGIITMSISTSLQMFNFILCLAVFGFIVLTPLFTLCFIRANREQLKVHEEGLFQKFGSLFYEFCNDHGLFTSLFYFFFFMRRLVFLCILFAFEAYPLPQTIMNFVLSTAVIFT